MLCYVVEKGLIVINGIFLIVCVVVLEWFEVSFILVIFIGIVLEVLLFGDEVNVEVDIIVKYLEVLMNKERLC